MNRTSLSQFVLIPLLVFIISLSGCQLFENDSSSDSASNDPTLPADWVDPGSEVEQPTPVYPEGGFDVEVKRTTYGIVISYFDCTYNFWLLEYGHEVKIQKNA